MPPLLNHKGEPLIDAAGHVLTAGSLVRDEMFGEGIARGTVPLQRGEGVNVLIDWLGASPGEKPMSRRVACLTVWCRGEPVAAEALLGRSALIPVTNSSPAICDHSKAIAIVL